MFWRRWAPALAPGVIGLFALSLGFATWRADRYAQRAEFPQAAFWRRDNATYWRVWGEQVLGTHPQQAIPILQRSIRLNPENPLSRMDLITAELGAGEGARATRLADRAVKDFPYSFRLHWLRANLWLAGGDRAQFWREFQQSCRLAADSYYDPMLARALTIPDTPARVVWARLPARSLAAAAGYVRMVQQFQPDSELHTALARLFLLSHGLTPQRQAFVRSTLDATLQRDLKSDPAEALMIWNRGIETGLYQGERKQARGELISASGFPAGSLQRYSANNVRWLSWFPIGDAATQLSLEEPPDGGRLVVDMNGMEGDRRVSLLRQWLFAPPEATLKVAAETRCQSRRDPAECGGFFLQLRQGSAPLFTLPLKTGAEWQSAHAEFTLPAASAAVMPAQNPRRASAPPAVSPPIAAYQLLLSYRRPFGANRLDGRFWVRRISVRAPAEGSPTAGPANLSNPVRAARHP